MRNNPFMNLEVDDYPPCQGCGDDVFPTDRPVRALDGTWHARCLKCTECKMTLNVKSLESYQKKPYCKAHRPDPKLTQVDAKSDLMTKQNMAKPKAARREHGIDKTARQTFYGGGKLDEGREELDFDSGKRADTGSFETDARGDSVADAGSGWGAQKSDTGSFESGPRATYDKEPERNAAPARSAPSRAPAASRGPPAASRGPPAASRGPPAASRGPPAASRGPPAASRAPPAAKPAPPAEPAYEEEAYEEEGYEEAYEEEGYEEEGYEEEEAYEEEGYEEEEYYEEEYYEEEEY